VGRAAPLVPRLEGARRLSELRIRQAVRAILLDPEERILLGHVTFPTWLGWMLPGGGVVAGEDDESALRRELFEETGLLAFELGPLVWTRRHAVDTAHWDGQLERYFLVRTPWFEPTPHLPPDELDDEYGPHILRWWTLDEIDVSDEIFAPLRLGPLLRTLLERGPPGEPLDAGP
jgi:8-oxo-dGTP pyrophosphatase MutT (NUDIX family)